MEKVFIGRDGMEAHFVRGLLDAEGIPAQVLGESLQIVRGEVPYGADTLPAVWVNSPDKARAEEIIADYECNKRRGESEEPAGQSWRCPGCGETIEAQFTQCWHCQADKSVDENR